MTKTAHSRKSPSRFPHTMVISRQSAADTLPYIEYQLNPGVCITLHRISAVPTPTHHRTAAQCRCCGEAVIGKQGWLAASRACMCLLSVPPAVERVCGRARKCRACAFIAHLSIPPVPWRTPWTPLMQPVLKFMLTAGRR